MSPLRYRAWDTVQGKMLYGNDVYCILLEDELKKLPRTNFGWRLPINSLAEAAKIEGCILMHSTGLHDKNGKEIFEGDILEWEGMRSVIQWDDEGCFATTFANPGTILPHRQMLVIGNIYENPELLPSAA